MPSMVPAAIPPVSCRRPSSALTSLLVARSLTLLAAAVAGNSRRKFSMPSMVPARDPARLLEAPKLGVDDIVGRCPLIRLKVEPDAIGAIDVAITAR